MYSTCIGLILKGYNDYEHKRKQFDNKFKKVEVPEVLKKEEVKKQLTKRKNKINSDTTKRKGLNNFWDKFKDRLIDMFKEEEDKEINSYIL